MKRTHTIIPRRIRLELSVDPQRYTCALKNFPGHVCEGRITREHATYYAGKKIQERWAIIFLCANGHGVDLHQDAPGQLPKEVRQWVALNQATISELEKYDRAFPSFLNQRKYLNDVFGEYTPPALPLYPSLINY